RSGDCDGLRRPMNAVARILIDQAPDVPPRSRIPERQRVEDFVAPRGIVVVVDPDAGRVDRPLAGNRIPRSRLHFFRMIDDDVGSWYDVQRGLLPVKAILRRGITRVPDVAARVPHLEDFIPMVIPNAAAKRAGERSRS